MRNFTLTNSFVADARQRKLLSLSVVDKETCVAICSYELNLFGSPCFDITITNNIAAGCFFAGFIAPGDECNSTTSLKFRDNISHSNLGAGALPYPDVSLGTNQNQCYQVANFKSYKTTLPCVAAFYHTKEIRAYNLTCIDQEKGLNLQTAGEGEKLVSKLYDSFIYGETAADDCPNTANCRCKKKEGLMLFGHNKQGKDLHIPSPS